MNQARAIQITAITGGLAVIVGAFGAHGLESRLSEDMLAVYETGVQYHFYHVLAMAALACSGGGLWGSPWAGRAFLAWTLGILVFSGSLYALALTEIKWLGAITPIGGVAMILGWAFLAPAAAGIRARD